MHGCVTFFQASINQGTIPSDWKDAFVVPIFKKGDKSCASNYHPVSLTGYMQDIGAYNLQ
jgi:hypothetical protein